MVNYNENNDLEANSSGLKVQLCLLLAVILDKLLRRNLIFFTCKMGMVVSIRSCIAVIKENEKIHRNFSAQ